VSLLDISVLGNIGLEAGAVVYVGRVDFEMVRQEGLNLILDRSVCALAERMVETLSAKRLNATSEIV
jgi:hypothetical protein